MTMADKKPYGDVSYADPGYQSDGKARYPVDTAEHAKAAWSYINQAGNGGKYTSAQLSAIKSRIKSAMHKFGMETADASRSMDALEEAAAWYTDYADHLESPDPVIEPVVTPHGSNNGSYSRYMPLEDVSIRTVGTGRNEARE